MIEKNKGNIYATKIKKSIFTYRTYDSYRHFRAISSDGYAKSYG